LIVDTMACEVLPSMVDEKSLIDARVDVARFVALSPRAPFRRFVALQAAHRVTGPPTFSHGKGRHVRLHQRCGTTGKVSLEYPGRGQVDRLTLLSKQGQMWAFLISTELTISLTGTTDP
jgi:hypothetical protein